MSIINRSPLKWVVIVAAALLVGIAAGAAGYSVFWASGSPADGRAPFGATPAADRPSPQQIAYTATYRLMQDLSAPWLIDREPAAVSTAPPPSAFRPQTSWQQLAGPYLDNGWPDVRSFDIKALASFQGHIYAGIRAGWSYNRDDIALVFRYDGERWEHVGGDGVFGSWPAGTQSRIQNLEVIGGMLYAAIGGALTGEAEVWRFDGSVWELFGGNGLGWDEGDHDVAYSIREFDGAIYVGVHSLDFVTPPAVYRFDGSWGRVAGHGERGSWPPFAGDANTYFQPYEMYVYQGELYLGMTSHDPRLDIWRFDGDRWERVAGDGLNDSWVIESTHRRHYLITDLFEHEGLLIATLAFWGDEQFHPVWAFDGETWAPVGNVLPPQWRYNRNTNSATSWNGRLYAGMQNPWIGASLWEFDGSAWAPVLGYGQHGSWGAGEPPGGVWAFPFHGYVYTLIDHEGALVASLGSEVVGGAQIWAFDPPNIEAARRP